MYRSGPRPPSSSHRPKDSGGDGSLPGRSSGVSSGPARRPSPPPSGSSSSRTQARRPRSPSGHRGRRPSPSPPRGRRASPSSPRGRRLSPSPPRGRRLLPPGPGGFRGASRGDSRDRSGDGGSRRHSPGLHSDSLDESLRITVGNDHFCASIPERRCLSDRLESPVDDLEDVGRGDLTEDLVFTRSSQCSRGLDRFISRQERPLSPFLGHRDEDYRTRETYLHRSDYSPHISCHDELLEGTEQNRNKLKGSYYTRPEERSREAKRPRYDDREKIHSRGDDQPGFTSGTRNYRQRRRSPSPEYLDSEFEVMDLARRKQEEEKDRNRSVNQELLRVDDGGTSCPIPGLSTVLPSSEPGYSLHHPAEVSVMPKKSILKKRIEVNVDSSMQPESFSSNTSSSQDHSLYSGCPSVPLSGATATFASEIENSGGTVVDTPLSEPQGSPYQRGPLTGQTKHSSPFREKFGSFLCHKDKLNMKTEGHGQHTDFLLPHERASQDGSGFSRILSLLADSASTQEKSQCSFPDIEDEEKFLYGDEEDLKAGSPPKPLGGSEDEAVRQKPSSLTSSTPSIKLESEEPNPEYAKIHDLLKTIGLDIGVAEFSKMGVRTQERLHGKKPLRASADRCTSVDQRFSSDQYSSVDRYSVDRRFSADRCTSDLHSLESQEKHHNSIHSPEVSHAHSVSSVDPYLHKSNPPFLKSAQPIGHIAGTELVGRRFQSSVTVRCMLPSVPPTPFRLTHPPPLSQFRLPRSLQFSAARIPPNYQRSGISPPSFDAYSHYMAYAASRWPIYPTSQPSGHPLCEPHRLIPVTKQMTRSRPNLRLIPTMTPTKSKPEATALGSVSNVQNPVQESTPSSLIKYNPEKISDEKNRASQKQKVIEEREKLKSDREARQKKMYYLRNELERLHKQQGEMMRKKRREKDGHKDPLLMEVSRLQDNIMKDIAELRQEAEKAEKKQSELDKVAQILGINIFDKSEKSKGNKESTGKRERSKSPEKASSSNSFNSKKSNINENCSKPTAVYEYYDAGSHWCKDCNTICGTMFDFFTHMHNTKHTKTLDPYYRPWASKTPTKAKQDIIRRTDRITVPAKGSEFLIPITGYYCQLCEEFFGDSISGEQHVKGHQHNEKYKNYVDENPLYEERRNLDRQAGLAVVLETERRRQIELKRKLSEKPNEGKKEKKAKIVRETKENIKAIEEPEEFSESLNSPENKGTSATKLQLKEKVKKESLLSSSFGKFSWKKPEKEEEKNSVVVSGVPKEETVESSKDKEDSKVEIGKAKPIKIKLSGKTVVAHTSSWTPIVTTSTQTKIRPNLPIPSTVLRKSGSSVMSKPAPLNTFLSIKSTGTTAKPLPVVKESSANFLLPPDIISKAFGGEEVILKGSLEEKMALTEKKEPSHTPEEITPLPPPPPPPPLLPPAVPHSAAPSPTQVNAVFAPIKSNAAVSHTAGPSFLGLNVLNPVLPVSILASEQPVAIPSDETAPGVSENDHDQTLFSVLVRPPPPLSSVFSEQARKLEKRNLCLATANAKDLYDIFYSSGGGGKGASETKLNDVLLANGENSNLSKTESSDISSTLNSSASQEKLSPGSCLVSAPANSSEKSDAKTLMSLGKWSVVEQTDSKCKDNSCGFLQPLTRLCQSKPYETFTLQTDSFTRWSSSTSQSDASRNMSLEGRNDIDLGDSEQPDIEPAELSEIHCHAMDSQKLVEAHLMESGSQDGENQEFHHSKEYGECVADTNTELKERGARHSERMVGEGIGVSIGPSSTENTNMKHGDKYIREREAEQPKLQMTDKKAEQSKKMITRTEIQNRVVTELSTQTHFSTEEKIDSYQSDVKSLLQNPPSKPLKISAPELCLQSSARSDIYLTNSTQQQGVLADSEERTENSAPESSSKASTYRSLKLKRERPEDFQEKVTDKQAAWDENKPEVWESLKKSEAEVLEVQDVHPELKVTVEKKALEDFKIKNLKVEEITPLGNLADTAHRFPVALVQNVCEENSLLPIGCSCTTTTTDLEPTPSFSEFPSDSPKTLVLNFAAEGGQNLSNPRSRRITHNILKPALSVENADELSLGTLEGTHQALDLLSGGMMPEEIEETQLEKQDSLKLESETMNSTGAGPSPCLPDLVDFVTRTSGVQKEMCSPFSEPGDTPECSPDMEPVQLEKVNASFTDPHLQVDEDDNNTLNLVTSLAPQSPSREHVVRGNVIPQEITTQEATVDAIQDPTECTVHDQEYTSGATCE